MSKRVEYMWHTHYRGAPIPTGRVDVKMRYMRTIYNVDAAHLNWACDGGREEIIAWKPAASQ